MSKIKIAESALVYRRGVSRPWVFAPTDSGTWKHVTIKGTEYSLLGDHESGKPFWIARRITKEGKGFWVTDEDRLRAERIVFSNGAEYKFP